MKNPPKTQFAISSIILKSYKINPQLKTKKPQRRQAKTI